MRSFLGFMSHRRTASRGERHALRRFTGSRRISAVLNLIGVGDTRAELAQHDRRRRLAPPLTRHRPKRAVPIAGSRRRIRNSRPPDRGRGRAGRSSLHVGRHRRRRREARRCWQKRCTESHGDDASHGGLGHALPLPSAETNAEESSAIRGDAPEVVSEQASLTTPPRGFAAVEDLRDRGWGYLKTSKPLRPAGPTRRPRCSNRCESRHLRTRATSGHRAHAPGSVPRAAPRGWGVFKTPKPPCRSSLTTPNPRGRDEKATADGAGPGHGRTGAGQSTRCW